MISQVELWDRAAAHRTASAILAVLVSSSEHVTPRMIATAVAQPMQTVTLASCVSSAEPQTIAVEAPVLLSQTALQLSIPPLGQVDLVARRPFLRQLPDLVDSDLLELLLKLVMHHSWSTA